MVGRFAGYPDVQSAEVSVAVAYTGGSFDANAVLGRVPRMLIVGTAGNVVCQLQKDSTDRTLALQAGLHPLAIKSITETGTTATGLFVAG